jgi:hypothetical protein
MKKKNCTPTEHISTAVKWMKFGKFEARPYAIFTDESVYFVTRDLINKVTFYYKFKKESRQNSCNYTPVILNPYKKKKWIYSLAKLGKIR